MANWSSDNFWFGILPDQNRIAVLGDDYQGELQRMLSNLAWKPTTGGGWPYRIRGLGNFGPALCISGEGKYGEDLPLAKPSWDFFNSHVTVWSSHDGYDDYIEHRIWIANELVYERTIHFIEGPAENAIWDYVGRTPEERHFFERLLPILNKGKTRIDVIAGALAGNSREEGEAMS